MIIYVLDEFWTFTPFPSPLITSILIMIFLWCLKTSRLKKVLLQSGHTNPTPRCTFLTWVQIAALEVDGPSLQPSTWHWYTHLVPPSWILRGCIWASMLPSGAGVAAGGADTVVWPIGSETSGLVDSWGGCWETEELGLRWGHGKGG